MKTVTTLSFAAITALFIGCGGGGGGNDSSPSSQSNTNSSTTTAATSSAATTNGGIFVDAAVKGLSYTCHGSETTGVTDVDGKYECANGDTMVTFAIGTRNLGITAIEDVISPRSFFNGTGRDEEIANLAQLLQSMDKDGNPDNGIELNEDDIRNWQDSHTGFDNEDFDTLVANELGKTLVGESAALEHLNGVLNTFGISTVAGSGTSTGNSSSSTSTSTSGSTTSCEYEFTDYPPHTDTKVTATGGISVECDSSVSGDLHPFNVMFPGGSETIDLQSIRIEAEVDQLSTKRYRNTYRYTPEAFTITYYDAHDFMNNLIQESCTRTYNPAELSAMDPYMIKSLIHTPYFGNLNGEISSTCESGILYFGEMDISATPGKVSTFKYTAIFTDTQGKEHKVVYESEQTLPQ